MSVLVSLGSKSTGTQRQRNVGGEAVWNELLFLPHCVIPAVTAQAADVFVYLCLGKPKLSNAVCFTRISVGRDVSASRGGMVSGLTSRSCCGRP